MTKTVVPLDAVASRRKARIGLYLVLPGFLFLLCFFVVPIVTQLATSLYKAPADARLGQFVPALEFGNYGFVLSQYWPAIVRTFAYSLVATLLCLLIGYPLAYLVAIRLRKRPLIRALVLLLIVAPFFVSFVLRAQAWRMILADDSFVASALRWLHVLPADGRLTATSFAVVTGLTYSFIPYMVLPIYANLERLDYRLIEAGTDLYAPPLTTFWRVTLPLSMPGVVAGTLLTFIPATGDYVNAVLLGNPSTTVLGQVIDSRFLTVIDYPSATALSTVLMGIVLVIVSVYIAKFGTDEVV